MNVSFDFAGAMPKAKADAAPIPALATARDHAALAQLAKRPGSGVRRIALPADATGRARFVQRWLARHARRAGQGMAASALVLPLLPAMAAAEASGEKHFYEALTLPGVEAVVLNDDGTATLTLASGRTYLVPPEDVLVLEDGTIAVNGAAAADLVQLPGAQVFMLAGAAALANAVAGGSSTLLLPDPTSGIVVDGYIVGATVFRDLDDDGVLDVGEPFTTTGPGGTFSLPHSDDPASLTARIVSTGGIDETTGATITGSWSAPASATVISPLSSLVQALVDNGSTEEAAKTQVREFFDLDEDTDPLTADPVDLADGGKLEVLKAAAKVQAVISTSVSVASKAAQDAGNTLSEAQVFQTSQEAARQIVQKLQADKTALTKAESVTEVIKMSAAPVVTVDDAKAADAGGAIAKVNEEVAKVTVATGATASTIIEQVVKIEELQTLSQQQVVDKITAGETNITETTTTAADNITQGLSGASDVPYRPVLNTQRLANDGTIELDGQGRPGAQITIALQDAVEGTTLATTTATVTEAGTWQASLTGQAGLQDGLYNVRLVAELPGLPASAARNAPLNIGDANTAQDGWDFFFYGTDLSALEVDDSVSTGKNTISVIPQVGTESFVYQYTETGDNFSAGVANLPAGTQVAIDGVRKDLATELEVRIINYAWTDGDAEKSSVVLTFFDKASGLDYIGQMGGDPIPDFVLREQVENWVNGAQASEVPLASDLGPGKTITLQSIADFAQSLIDDGRDAPTYSTILGKAGAGATVEIKLGGTLLGTTTADASGRWAATIEDPEQTIELGLDTMALKITNSANVVDNYLYGSTGSADTQIAEAGLRTVLMGFEDNSDKVNVADFGLDAAGLEALLATKTVEQINPLGTGNEPSVVLGGNGAQQIVFVGIGSTDLITAEDFLLQANT